MRYIDLIEDCRVSVRGRGAYSAFLPGSLALDARHLHHPLPQAALLQDEDFELLLRAAQFVGAQGAHAGDHVGSGQHAVDSRLTRSITSRGAPAGASKPVQPD